MPLKLKKQLNVIKLHGGYAERGGASEGRHAFWGRPRFLVGLDCFSVVLNQARPQGGGGSAHPNNLTSLPSHTH